MLDEAIAAAVGDRYVLRDTSGLRTIGGGLYQLPLRSQNVELVVAPHSTGTAQFTMWGTANGSMRQHVAEATTLRGVAYFESAAGPMQKLFTTTIDIASR